MKTTFDPQEDVDIAEKDTPFSGYFRVDRYRLKHRRFNGGWTALLEREIFERGHAAAVLPYDPVADKVVLIEQFRLGARAAGQAPWLMEIVAGIIEEGESPEDLVRRESVEEAGVELHDVESIGHYLVSPGGSSEMLYLYCGRVDSRGLGGIHGLEAEGEDIRVEVLPFEQAVQLYSPCETAGKGALNMTAAFAMQWLQINRARLRRQWGTE
ncbi:MAG: NUDIX domain-containing protein [Pseudomonadota bacterium]